MKRTEKKRKDIIDAAIDEFEEQGFLGAKTTSIAKKANVSSRTLYNHFESKEALFEAISQIMLEQNRSMEPVPHGGWPSHGVAGLPRRGPTETAPA